MRLRCRAQCIPRKASPDPELKARLEAARLYVITPDATRDGVVEIARAAVRGGADVVQLRHKTLRRGELLDLARRMRDVVRGVLFVVDDYVDIALLSDADGVHLGPHDLSVGAARRVVGERLLIGASASSVEAARAAVANGADYLGCGPAFSTPIKTEKRVIGPAAIAQIASNVDVPVFAIGGINETNTSQVIAAGVRRICVIRAVGDAADPEAASRRLRAMLGA